MPTPSFIPHALPLILVSLLAACASLPQPASTPLSSPVLAAPEAAPSPAPAILEPSYPKQALSPELLFGFLLGDMAAIKGDRPMAAHTWLELAQRTQDARAAQRALELSYQAGLLEQALTAAQLWRKLDPEQQAARQILINLLPRAGRLAEMEGELRNWLVDRPQDAPKLFLQLHTLWPEQIDKQATLLIAKRLANDYADLPEAALAVAMAAQKAQQIEVALAATEQALKLRQDWETAILYRAALLDTRGSDAAIQYLSQQQARLPKSREIQNALARSLSEAGQRAQARQHYQALAQQYPQDIEYALGIALASLQLRDFAEAETALEQALNMSPKRPDALHYYLGLAKEELYKLESARDHYRQVQAGEQQQQALSRQARIEARLGQKEAALATLARIKSETDDDKISHLQLQAQIWRELKELRQARLTLDQGLKQFPKQADLLYDRSLIFEQMGDVNAAETDLRAYLALNPDSAIALNALGYTLANRTERYDEAEALLKQALLKEPENPIILDSMGWLALKRGNAQEAVRWLSKAFTQMPDPEIAAHYGEALWRTGQQVQARKVWEQGRKLDPQHAVLAETIQRFEAK